jgi:poly(3-hydroxybutyrate) depolymerase
MILHWDGQETRNVLAHETSWQESQFLYSSPREQASAAFYHGDECSLCEAARGLQDCHVASDMHQLTAAHFYTMPFSSTMYPLYDIYPGPESI